MKSLKSKGVLKSEWKTFNRLGLLIRLFKKCILWKYSAAFALLKCSTSCLFHLRAMSEGIATSECAINYIQEKHLLFYYMNWTFSTFFFFFRPKHERCISKCCPIILGCCIALAPAERTCTTFTEQDSSPTWTMRTRTFTNAADS